VPLQFTQTIRTWMRPKGRDPILVSDGLPEVFGCRDVAIGAIYRSVFNRSMLTAMLPYGPDNHGLNINGDFGRQTNQAATIIGTFLRNPDALMLEIRLLVLGVTDDDLAKIRSKLQARYTTVALSVEYEEKKSFHRNQETKRPVLVLRGNAETVPCWWWAVVMMRISAHNKTWTALNKVLEEEPRRRCNRYRQ
jgi:hypothetical protein